MTARRIPVDTDATMAANSDSRIASQKAVKTALATKQADLGVTLDTDVTLAANSDTRVPSQKAVKTAIANSGSLPSVTLTPATAADALTATVTDGTQATGLRFSPTHQAASGGMGLHLSRDVTGRSLMLSLESGGSVIWETTALDATTTDLILAYDPAHGDQLRIRQGAHMLYDLVAGQPSTTHRLQLSTQAAGEDSGLRNLLYYSAVTGSPVTSYVKGAKDGVENFQVTTAGLIGGGKTVAGYISGGHEFATAITIQRSDATPTLRFRRDGTGLQQWEARVQQASSDRFEIADVTGSKVPFIIAAGATAGIQIDGAGGVALGKPYSGYISGGSEAEGAITVHKTDGSAVVRLRRDGTATQQWEVRVDHSASPADSFVIADLTGGTSPFSIQPGAPAAAFSIQSDGGLAKVYSKTLAAGAGDVNVEQQTVTLAGAFTVNRLNYRQLKNPGGAATVTDAAVFSFDAAAGTHKAIDGATTKATPGAVDGWMKINVNGTIWYIAAYASKTA